MKNVELQDRLALSLVKSNDERIMAAGPITRQPSTVPYRVVMVNFGTQISVHNQYFDCEGTDLAAACESAVCYLENGDYFNPEELKECIERFAERCKRHAEYAQSIFRGILETA